MTRPRSLVILNPAARGGDAERLWADVELEVLRHSEPRVVFSDAHRDCLEAVTVAVAEGVRVFVAAGGDGTVSALANALFHVDPAFGSTHAPFTLGAVGLGSSNDFHKPIQRRLRSVPLRVDPAQARPRDVGVARYRDARGREHARVFLVSASLGLAAEANAAFNDPGPVARWLRRRSTTAAIACAALGTFATYRRFPARLTFGGHATLEREAQITSLSIMKTPFLSGWMRFDTPVEPDDGLFAINLCDDLGRGQTLAVMADLSRGRFLASDRSGTHHWRAPELTAAARRPFALELDGEIVHTEHVAFEILPHRLRCCS